MTRRQLRECIRNDGGFERAAQNLGCTSARLYQLVSENGHELPSFELAAGIEARYGIAMAEWQVEAA